MTHELSEQEMLERQAALGGVRDLVELKEKWESLQPAHTKPNYSRGYGSGSAGNGRLMESRYNGRCADCSGPIAAGDMIRYDGKAHHVDEADCEAWRDAEAARQEGDELQARYDAVEAEWLAMQGIEAPTPVESLVPILAQPLDDESAPAIPGGVYTLVCADGEYKTIKVHSPKRGNFVGKVILSYLYGPDNGGDFEAFGFLIGARCALWKRYSQNVELRALVEALADPTKAAEAGLAYALASGNCYKCGRRLTVPASIHNGMGPDCAAKA